MEQKTHGHQPPFPPDANTPEFLFRAISRMHKMLFFKQLQEKGFSDNNQWSVLHILCRPRHSEDQPMTQKDIAEEIGFSPATITAVIKDMVKQGLVEKKPDADDLRCNHIFPTEKGKQAMKEHHKSQHTMEMHMYEGFSPEEKQQLAAYYLRICENLVKMGARRPRFMCGRCKGQSGQPEAAPNTKV